MKPEEFEVYVIPPNFMEGGTLFGGLLKTRNTIEAVILGLAVGVPVLHLPFSLTVRVVILCLTALPLVLLALIGVQRVLEHEWPAVDLIARLMSEDLGYQRFQQSSNLQLDPVFGIVCRDDIQLVIVEIPSGTEW